MDQFVKEMQLENSAMTYKINEIIFEKNTKFQNLKIVDSIDFGRMLLLDGIVQTTVNDEWIYHEVITHIPVFSHPNPKKVLVVGGGDGGAIRELLRHDTIDKVVLCEIDEDVINASIKYLPEISCELNNPRCEIFIGDGIKYVHEHKNEFDIIIVDSTDPFGFAEGLFGGSFYNEIFNALKEDGIFIAQTESPFFFPDIVSKVVNDSKKVFTHTKLFMAGIPTYPGGYWSFTVGSKKYDPTIRQKRNLNFKTKYYTEDLHSSCFILPAYIKDLTK